MKSFISDQITIIKCVNIQKRKWNVYRQHKKNYAIIVALIEIGMIWIILKFIKSRVSGFVYKSYFNHLAI